MRVAIKVCATLVLSVGALISAGCVESPDETAIDDEGEEEAVGKTQQAIGGEAGCATVSITSSVFGASTAYAGPNTDLFSPDDKYNPGSTCPNQYIGEYTGWNTAPADSNLAADWDIALPTNSSDCGAARLTMNFYGYNGSWNTTPTGERRYNGSWNGSVCSWNQVLTSGSIPSHTNTKVRVVAFGYMSRPSVYGAGNRTDFKPITTRATEPF